MAEMLLIHGSNHGAWCWEEVLPRLAALGHAARAIDLPGMGDDPMPPERVTLEDNVAAIVAQLRGPTVLVGHSLGGVSITAVAELAPQRVARLVYVTAWAPQNGESARSLRAAHGCEALRDAITSDDGGLTTRFRDEALAPLLYHDCPEGTADRARARLRPQPGGVSRSPVAVTARGAEVPRAYILCENDRAIIPAAQSAQCEGWDEVHRLPCGHSPFYACPEALAETLHRIASA
jgi:pimeloyl-ACP methyl ester carboxylesterase